MKKTLVSLLLLAAMIVNIFAFTSCFKPKGSGLIELDLTGAYDGSQVTITFWHTMGADNRTLLEGAIKRFNQMYPNIKVEHQNYGDYDEVFSQIRTKMNAGKQPNIAYCYPDHVATYNKARVVLTLDDLINNTSIIASTGEMMGLTQDQLNDFIEGYYNEGKAYGDGKMYSLPFQKSTEVLYYNKTVFDRLGLEAPKTWDDVENAIQVLKAEYPRSIPLGYDSAENMFITLAAQNHPNDPNGGYTSATGEHYIFDNDVNKAFTKKFAEWYQKGWLYTPNPTTSGYTSDYFKKDDNEDGKIFMSIGSSAGARYQRPTPTDDGSYPFEVGIVSLPQVDVNNPKVISQGPSICIFEDENVQEVYASWLFVKFLTTDAQFQAQYSMASGYVPVIKSVGETQLYKDYLNKANGGDFITSLVAKVALEQEAAYFTSPAFAGSADARTNVGNLIYSVFANYDLNATDAANNAMINEKFALQIAECKK